MFGYLNLLPSNDHALIKKLTIFATISPAPLDDNAIHGRSATEWAINFGRFLASNISTDETEFRRAWGSLRFHFTPVWKQDVGTRIMILGPLGEDGKEMKEVWTPPTAHQLQAINYKIAWEQARLPAAHDLRSQEDKGADIKQKSRIRRRRHLRNLAQLLALRKAIKKGEKVDQTHEETAVEFTNGDETKAQSLLRSLRRNRNHPDLADT